MTTEELYNLIRDLLDKHCIEPQESDDLLAEFCKLVIKEHNEENRTIRDG